MWPCILNQRGTWGLSCRGTMCGSPESLTLTSMPDKSLHGKSILLRCNTEVADKHAGMCRWLVQMSLFSVSLPVAEGPLSCGLYCFGMWWEAAPCVSLPRAAYSGYSFCLCANSTIDHSVVLQVPAACCGRGRDQQASTVSSWGMGNWQRWRTCFHF